jgi:single-stranded-DNA-specific exonuclease
LVELCQKEGFNIYKPGQETADLSVKFGCTLLQAALLEMRGLTAETPKSVVKQWLAPDMEQILESMDLGTRGAAAAEIYDGLSERSNVVVYGDYDVDGISATAIAIEMALRKGAQVRYFIPHRFKQGYGLHADTALKIAKRRCDLVVVVDCGSQDREAVDIIKKSGTPVAIFDHHLVEGEPAQCDTIVNPHLGGDQTARQLCAAGVIWCWAWKNELLPKDVLMGMLDLVAMATVADCVSLSSPLNRVLVREGLRVMRMKPRAGLRVLMDKMNVNYKRVTTEDLSMRIIPCLNAAGRMYLADPAVDLLFPGTNLEEQADRVIALNRKRRELSTKILDQVDAAQVGGYRYVLSNEEWSVGVLSSVASRICIDRNAPVALVASAGEVMRGTLRMPKGGDAVGVLKELSPFLNTWGGHRLAAGFSVKNCVWEELRDEMERLLSEVKITGEKEDLLYWTPASLDMKIWTEAEELGPFGMGNPYPKLYSPYNGNITVLPLGKNGRHVKIDLGDSTLLGFGAAEAVRDREDFAGWVYKPRLDTWRNVTSLQLVLDKVIVI